MAFEKLKELSKTEKEEARKKFVEKNAKKAA